MTTSHTDAKRVEDYARQLLNASVAQGRSAADLEQVRHTLKFSPEVIQTIAEMHEEGDDKLVTRVHRMFKDMLDRGDITVSVDVTTAMPMSCDLKAKVRAKCEQDFDAPVYIVEHVDPKIIGGIIIEAKGKRRDASVRAQLVNIRKTLSSTFLGSDEQ